MKMIGLPGVAGGGGTRRTSVRGGGANTERVPGRTARRARAARAAALQLAAGPGGGAGGRAGAAAAPRAPPAARARVRAGHTRW